jgi:hypothetical protein
VPWCPTCEEELKEVADRCEKCGSLLGPEARWHRPDRRPVSPAGFMTKALTGIAAFFASLVAQYVVFAYVMTNGHLESALMLSIYIPLFPAFFLVVALIVAAIAVLCLPAKS